MTALAIAQTAVPEHDWYAEGGGELIEERLGEGYLGKEEERLAAGKQRRRQPSHGKLRL